MFQKHKSFDFISIINQKRDYKNTSGITLVALVISIIILLILAGVSMQLFVGESGILKRTEYAKFATEISTIKEQVELALEQPTDNYFSGLKSV